MKNYSDTIGAGGGGKSSGGGGVSEAPDTLITDEIIKSLNLIGEGPITLYTDSVNTYPGQSIFINNIPFQNVDGSKNFSGNSSFEVRTGLPSQAPLSLTQFPGPATVYTLNEQAYGGTGVAGTVSTAGYSTLTFTTGSSILFGSVPVAAKAISTGTLVRAAAGVYTFNVAIDGASAVVYNVTLTGTDTFSSVAALLNVALTGLATVSVVQSGVNYNTYKITSASVGSASAVIVTIPAGSGTDLITTMSTKLSATSTLTAVAGTTGATAATPVIYDVTSGSIDYVKVGIGFPHGLEMTSSGGSIVGDSVTFALDTQITGDPWVQVGSNITINDKSSQPAVIQYQLNNPSGSGSGIGWNIRLRRITQDNETSIRKNAIWLETVEEIEAITLPYNGVAYIGVNLDAAGIGGSSASVPTLSFLMQGLSVNVPSNYNVTTRVYTGLWDGTFTTGVTDNPAWILYDALTNPNYGCGIYNITPAMVDKYSFYNAGVFNDAYVLSGVGVVTATQFIIGSVYQILTIGSTDFTLIGASANTIGVYFIAAGVGAGTGTATSVEPRFTWNAPIQNRQDMLKALQDIAGMMNGVLGTVNGLITLFQDRPTSSMYPISKANVLGAGTSKSPYFTYNSSAITTRTTACNVTWTNALDLRYLPKTVSVTDPIGLSRYGYQTYDLAALGATSEGQAQRAGKWWLYTNQHQTETVIFKMGLLGLDVNLYDVFDLYDEDYTQQAGAGRVVSATTNTITFDQPIVVSGGSPTVSVWQMDGASYETHAITTGPGTWSTVSISGTWTIIPAKYAAYIITSAIAPRTFRVINIKIDGVTKAAQITAQLYDKNNYTNIEGGVAISPSVYTAPITNVVADVTGITITPNSYINPIDGSFNHGINLTWTPPATKVSGYLIKWRVNSGTYVTTPKITLSSYELTNAAPGAYDFVVYVLNINNSSSLGASASYTLSTIDEGPSTILSEITTLTTVPYT